MAERLFETIAVDGVPAVDVIVVRKDVGDAWLERYLHAPGVPVIPGPPLMSDVVPVRAQWQKALPVARGYYYVVVDNSSSVGAVAPPAATIPILAAALVSQPSAMVEVAIQLGDAP